MILHLDATEAQRVREALERGDTYAAWTEPGGPCPRCSQPFDLLPGNLTYRQVAQALKDATDTEQGLCSRCDTGLVAPERFIAVDQQCETCSGKGNYVVASTRGQWETDVIDCPHCVGGRKVIKLRTKCRSCDGGRVDCDSDWLCPTCGSNGSVLLAHAVVRVIPDADGFVVHLTYTEQP